MSVIWLSAIVVLSILTGAAGTLLWIAFCSPQAKEISAKRALEITGKIRENNETEEHSDNEPEKTEKEKGLEVKEEQFNSMSEVAKELIGRSSFGLPYKMHHLYGRGVYNYSIAANWAVFDYNEISAIIEDDSLNEEDAQTALAEIGLVANKKRLLANFSKEELSEALDSEWKQIIDVYNKTMIKLRSEDAAVDSLFENLNELYGREEKKWIHTHKAFEDIQSSTNPKNAEKRWEDAFNKLGINYDDVPAKAT